MSALEGTIDDKITPSLAPQRRKMTRQQKAAVIVRVLLSAGADPGIAVLPPKAQEQLAREMAELRIVNKDALSLIVTEFTHTLENIGVHFPPGLSGALQVLSGHLAPSTADHLREISGAEIEGDPWERLTGLDVNKLKPIVEEESIEVCAVLLSKLSVTKAAELLSHIPQERAHHIAYAVSLTGSIDPETVARIGVALGRQLDAQPAMAFRTGATERVGAILNASPANTRDAVLDGLENADAVFAEQVRRAIFTFENIPQRIAPRDLPKLTRAVNPTIFTTALAFGKLTAPKVVDFILDNISQRQAQALKDEMEDLGQVSKKDGELAMRELINGVRAMEAAGEIFLIVEE